MGKEILFRGKRLVGGEWVYGDLRQVEGKSYILDYDIGDDGISDIQKIFNIHHKVDPTTVGQFTGLRAKGTRIFEGDIVKQTYHAETGYVHDGTEMSFDGHHIGEVIITAYRGVCLRNPLNYSVETDETTVTNQYKNVAAYRSEVIGNKFDNPELLGGTSHGI